MPHGRAVGVLRGNRTSIDRLPAFVPPDLHPRASPMSPTDVPARHRTPLFESLETRLALSATAAGTTNAEVGRYLGNEVAIMGGVLQNVRIIVNVTSTKNGKIIGTVSTPAGIFSFNAGLHMHSNGRFQVPLTGGGTGTLVGRFIDGNNKFTGSINATGRVALSSVLDLKRNCGCQSA